MKDFMRKAVAILLLCSMIAIFASCENNPPAVDGGNQGDDLVTPEASDDQSNETGDNYDDQEPPMPDYGFESMFPDDWTGGFFREWGNDVEYCWVETYDELIVAIEKLKSHGSTFASDAECIVNYDGSLFDVKYCIEISNLTGTEPIVFGEDPFDRFAEKVRIMCWGFLEEVTIDEINYGYVEHMQSFRVFKYDSFAELYPQYKDNIINLERYELASSVEDGYILAVFHPGEYNKRMLGVRTHFDLQLYDEEVILETVLLNVGCLEL